MAESEVTLLRNELAKLQERMNQQEKSIEESGVPVRKEMEDLTNFLRRDFRIAGQIGDPGQLDKLSFISLIRQIEAAVKKGYKDDEIVAAVVKAIVPGHPLRSYLEGKDDLSLSALRGILRAHYQEKSATELYQSLCNVTQSPREDPQTYLIRALDLRQKVLFSSKESGSVIYDPKLVQGLFLRALETGLQNDIIRQELRQLLENPDVNDQDLIKQMNFITSREKERNKKLGFNKANKVHQLDVQSNVLQEKLPKMEAKAADTKTDEPWKKMLSEIKEELATITRRLDEQERKKDERQPQMVYQQRSRQIPRDRGCYKCRQSGSGLNCSHCFKCGSSEHWSRGCKQQRGNTELNQQWESPWDRPTPR